MCQRQCIKKHCPPPVVCRRTVYSILQSLHFLREEQKSRMGRIFSLLSHGHCEKRDRHITNEPSPGSHLSGRDSITTKYASPYSSLHHNLPEHVIRAHPQVTLKKVVRTQPFTVSPRGHILAPNGHHPLVLGESAAAWGASSGTPIQDFSLHPPQRTNHRTS